MIRRDERISYSEEGREFYEGSGPVSHRVHRPSAVTWEGLVFESGWRSIQGELHYFSGQLVTSTAARFNSAGRRALGCFVEPAHPWSRERNDASHIVLSLAATRGYVDSRGVLYDVKLYAEIETLPTPRGHALAVALRAASHTPPPRIGDLFEPEFRSAYRDVDLHTKHVTTLAVETLDFYRP